VFAYLALVLVLANLFYFKSGVKFGLIWSTVVNLPILTPPVTPWFPVVIKPGLLFQESIAMMPNHLATAAWLKKHFSAFDLNVNDTVDVLGGWQLQ